MTHQHDTETTWAELYTHAITRFDNQRPTTLLEQVIVQHFERHPAEVRAAIDKTAARFAAGKIHSPWPIVKSELDNVDKRHTIRASEDTERTEATQLAEHYTHNAALYCPTLDEYLDEIFGPNGRLKPWANDQQLRDRMAALYHHHRPRAEQAEHDAQARAANWRTTHHHGTTHEPTTAPPSSPPADVPV